MMRESCFRCKYRTASRYSDIVVGDFWGIERIEPMLDVKAGASAVIINSLAAESFFKGCNIIKKEIEEVVALKALKGFIDTIPEQHKLLEIERMHKFEDDYFSHSFAEMYLFLYPRTTTIQKIIYSILFHLHLKK